MSFATKPLALALAGLLLTAPIAFAQVGGGSELPSSARHGGMHKGSMMMKGGMKHHHMKKSHMMKSKKMM